MNKIISKIIKILKEQDTLLEAELALEILFQADCPRTTLCSF